MRMGYGIDQSSKDGNSSTSVVQLVVSVLGANQEFNVYLEGKC